MRPSRVAVASIVFAVAVGSLGGADSASAGMPSARLSSERADLRVLPQPRRLVDTQPGSGYQGQGQPLTGLTDPVCFQIAGEVGIPDNATAVMANLTALRYAENGWITVFPAGASIPDTSNLNFDTDQYAVANLILVPIGDIGQVCAIGQSG